MTDDGCHPDYHDVGVHAPDPVDDMEGALTVREAAATAYVHPRTMQRIIAARQIAVVRVGAGRGRVYITRRALADYLSRRTR